MEHFSGSHVGELQDIADIVSPFAEYPDFLKYGEKPKGCPVVVELIIPFKDMLVKLYKLHPTLSFRQSDIAQVFGLVAEAKGSSWVRKLTKDELPSYETRIALRFRAMARHVSQALLKRTTWAVAMFDGEEEQGEG